MAATNTASRSSTPPTFHLQLLLALVAICSTCGMACRGVPVLAIDGGLDGKTGDGCTPACSGRNCGADDGCGGRCQSGRCLAGQRCIAGACICDETSCSAGCCAASTCLPGTADDSCGTGGAACDDCTARIQACGADRRCFDCQPDCAGKDCGADNGCGGTCSTGRCPTGLACLGGQCTCTRDSCADGCCDSAGACRDGAARGACGSGGEPCRSCEGQELCQDQQCRCVPSCPSCGIDDGCGDTCGCPPGEDCFGGSCAVIACQYCSKPSGDCNADCQAVGSSGGSCTDQGSTDPARCCTCNPKSSGTDPIGHFDTISSGLARGWACDPDNPWVSITVHLYVGGPAGSGAPGYAATANHSSGDAVKDLCGGGDYHRFSYQIPSWASQVGQPVYVYGISIHGGSNKLLANCPLSLQ